MMVEQVKNVSFAQADANRRPSLSAKNAIKKFHAQEIDAPTRVYMLTYSLARKNR